VQRKLPHDLEQVLPRDLVAFGLLEGYHVADRLREVDELVPNDAAARDLQRDLVEVLAGLLDERVLLLANHEQTDKLHLVAFTLDHVLLHLPAHRGHVEYVGHQLGVLVCNQVEHVLEEQRQEFLLVLNVELVQWDHNAHHLLLFVVRILVENLQQGFGLVFAQTQIYLQSGDHVRLAFLGFVALEVVGQLVHSEAQEDKPHHSWQDHFQNSELDFGESRRDHVSLADGGDTLDTPVEAQDLEVHVVGRSTA